MSGLTRSLRARSCGALWAGMLLGFTGLAATGLETVSFGHEHLTGAHGSHHNHVYLGSHDHRDARSDHDREHHEAPAPEPEDHDASRGTATVSVIPALFQPVVPNVLMVPLADSAPVVLGSALPLVMRPAILLTPPRAPPAALAEGSPT